jgi:small subunit ribosomal protein S16
VAVKIRLKRMGKIRQPHYRVVVVDGRKKRDGKVIEEIGKYHPKQEPSFIEVTSDRAQYWLGVGAQPSEAVEAILKITGDWQKFKGLPGTEGTLRFAEPKRDKTELFNEALKDAASEPRSGATTARKKAAKTEAPADEAPVAPPVEETPAAEAPAEAPAAEETPAESSTDESSVSSETAADADVAEATPDATAQATPDATADAEKSEG